MNHLATNHLVFLALVTLYVVTLGQNWGIYSAALMIAAYARHEGRLRRPVLTAR